MGITKLVKTVVLSAVVLVATAALAPSGAAAHARMFTYKLEVPSMERLGNTVDPTCEGASAVIHKTILYPLSTSTANFFASSSAYRKEYTVTLNAATRLIVKGPLASRVHNVCAIAETFGGAGYAETDMFTWHLTKRATSLAAIVAYSANEATMLTAEE